MIPFRGLAAEALSVVASVLGVSSRIASQGADLLRGDHVPPSTGLAPEPPWSGRKSSEPTSPEPMPWDRPAPTPTDDVPPGPAGPFDVEDVEAELAEEEAAEEQLDDLAPGPEDLGVVVEDLADAEPAVVDDIVAVDASRPAAPTPPPVAPQPALDDTAHVRAPDTHAAALAEKSAAEVIAAVDTLSTDELRALYEEESGGKKRKTVLAAVEQALTP